MIKLTPAEITIITLGKDDLMKDAGRAMEIWAEANPIMLIEGNADDFERHWQEAISEMAKFHEVPEETAHLILIWYWLSQDIELMPNPEEGLDPLVRQAVSALRIALATTAQCLTQIEDQPLLSEREKAWVGIAEYLVVRTLESFQTRTSGN